MIATDLMERLGIHRIDYLGTSGVAQDLAEKITIANQGPIEAVGFIRDGAKLMALQRNRYCYDGKNDHVDNGFWVAGFEYVTGVDSIVAGKPSSEAYFFAARTLGIDRNHITSIAMISDSVDFDLSGAHQCGMKTIHLCNRDELEPTWLTHRTGALHQAAELVMGM